jgi:hypothetical protein
MGETIHWEDAREMIGDHKSSRSIISCGVERRTGGLRITA